MTLTRKEFIDLYDHLSSHKSDDLVPDFKKHGCCMHFGLQEIHYMADRLYGIEDMTVKTAVQIVTKQIDDYRKDQAVKFLEGLE